MLIKVLFLSFVGDVNLCCFNRRQKTESSSFPACLQLFTTRVIVNNGCYGNQEAGSRLATSQDNIAGANIQVVTTNKTQDTNE